MGSDAEAIDGALAHVKSEDATASVEADLTAIRALVNSYPGGFPALNATVKQHLRRWFVSQGGCKVANRSRRFSAVSDANNPPAMKTRSPGSPKNQAEHKERQEPKLANAKRAIIYEEAEHELNLPPHRRHVAIPSSLTIPISVGSDVHDDDTIRGADVVGDVDLTFALGELNLNSCPVAA